MAAAHSQPGFPADALTIHSRRDRREADDKTVTTTLRVVNVIEAAWSTIIDGM
jgi:hypothetical protein